MAAGTYNATWEQGTTIDKVFTWREATDDDSLGEPIDITGYTARMQLRTTLDSDTVLHEFTTSNGGIELGDELGTIRLIASAEDTAAWDWPAPAATTTGTFTVPAAPPEAVYDLELIDSDGAVTRLLKGTITLDLEVTR